jgi:hypothetical protein
MAACHITHLGIIHGMLNKLEDEARNEDKDGQDLIISKIIEAFQAARSRKG